MVLSNIKVQYANNTYIIYKKLQTPSKHCKILKSVMKAPTKILIGQRVPSYSIMRFLYFFSDCYWHCCKCIALHLITRHNVLQLSNTKSSLAGQAMLLSA